MKDREELEDVPPNPNDERLPYEAPAVISEEVFETMALSCGPSAIFCQDNPPGMS